MHFTGIAVALIRITARAREGLFGLERGDRETVKTTLHHFLAELTWRKCLLGSFVRLTVRT